MDSTYNLSLSFRLLIGGQTDVTALILFGDGVGHIGLLLDVRDIALLAVGRPLGLVRVLSVELGKGHGVLVCSVGFDEGVGIPSWGSSSGFIVRVRPRWAQLILHRTRTPRRIQDPLARVEVKIRKEVWVKFGTLSEVIFESSSVSTKPSLPRDASCVPPMLSGVSAGE